MKFGRRILVAFLVALPVWPAGPLLCASELEALCDSIGKGLVPISELAGSYRGQPGGLYPGGSQIPPPGHDLAGRNARRSGRLG